MLHGFISYHKLVIFTNYLLNYEGNTSELFRMFILLDFLVHQADANCRPKSLVEKTSQEKFTISGGSTQ